MQPQTQDWSRTKKTLVMLLKQEVDELHQGVVEMRQEALLKNVSKRKVIFNLTRTGEIQLVYALLALAEYYQGKNYVDSSIRSLRQARELKSFGDASYLLGSALLKKDQKQEAIHWLQLCLNQEWIQPSQQHRTATKLQAMTQLQQLYFALGQREKLIQISYKKVQLSRQNKKTTEKHFHALALYDMALIHQALNESQLALQKLQGAITLFESEVKQPSKLVEAWRKRGVLMANIGKRQFVSANFKKVHFQVYQAYEVIQKNQGCVDQKTEVAVLQALIQSYILV